MKIHLAVLAVAATLGGCAAYDDGYGYGYGYGGGYPADYAYGYAPSPGWYGYGGTVAIGPGGHGDWRRDDGHPWSHDGHWGGHPPPMSHAAAAPAPHLPAHAAATPGRAASGGRPGGPRPEHEGHG